VENGPAAGDAPHDVDAAPFAGACIHRVTEPLKPADRDSGRVV
jgi:hypothetical protein